ncbi:EAL domain-containing protein [Enterobacteriaceae bacterium RIT691]|nr:EAL domain-containing protein [Enterobacteriaceae bacterium RIT691]
MTSKKMVGLVVGVLILSVFLPVTLSVWLAHYQAEKEFTDDLDAYGQRVILKTRQVVTDAKSALNEIDQFQGEACHDAHLLAMRRISYTHRDIQEVLWLNGLQPGCSSLESKSTEMRFPQPDRRTPDGFRIWLTDNNDLGIRHPMIALAGVHHMVMMDPASFVDVVPFAPWAMNSALIGLQTGRVIAKNADLDLRLWQQAHQAGQRAFSHDGMMYNLRDYPEIGLSQIVWASSAPLTSKWHQQLLIWLPLGGLISLLAALFILRLLKTFQSPRYRMLEAIATRTIEVHYQPIVSLQSGRIIGAEALARWQLPDGSWLSPDIFIPLAAQTGQMTRLTQLVIEKVFEDLGPWLNQHPELHISINLEQEDLVTPEIPTLLAQQLQTSGVAPSQIALELTERGLIDPKNRAQVLTQLRDAGHEIYIDDFGTGYSNLSYLQNLNVDLIKIDKSFVDTLEFNSVTPHIIEMVKSMQLAILAEGVETERQRQWLSEHGVQFAQGWLFSKALPKTAFITWAENNLRQQ